MGFISGVLIGFAVGGVAAFLAGYQVGGVAVGNYLVDRRPQEMKKILIDLEVERQDKTVEKLLNRARQ